MFVIKEKKHLLCKAGKSWGLSYSNLKGLGMVGGAGVGHTNFWVKGNENLHSILYLALGLWQ